MLAVSGRLGGGTRSVWNFLARGSFALKIQIKRVGFPWFSLDSLVRIQAYQRVTLDFRSKVFSLSFCPVALEAPEGKAAEEAMRKREKVHRIEHNADSDFLQSIVAPSRRKLNRPDGPDTMETNSRKRLSALLKELITGLRRRLPTSSSDYCRGPPLTPRGMTNFATDH